MSGYEKRQLEKIIGKFDRNSSVLDVGCGYGSKLEIFDKLGFKNTLGVEKNKHLVSRGIENGFNMVDLDQFNEKYSDQQFDMILMSHIIEHFQYNDLIEFFEIYLSKLKVNGNLIIVTPIMNPYFYNDFDHVKPYSPTGIIQVFGTKKLQFQTYSNIKLDLIDVKYIRQAFQLQYFRALTFRTRLYRIPKTINKIFYLIFRLSFRLLGTPESWIGIFQRTE